MGANQRKKQATEGKNRLTGPIGGHRQERKRAAERDEASADCAPDEGVQGAQQQKQPDSKAGEGLEKMFLLRCTNSP